MPVGFDFEAARRDMERQLAEQMRGQQTTIPDITDEAVLRKQYERKRRLAALQGRGSTFLTGPRGLGGPSSEIATAFLRAALQPPEPWPIAPLLLTPPPEDVEGAEEEGF